MHHVCYDLIVGVIFSCWKLIAVYKHHEKVVLSWLLLGFGYN